MRMIFRFELQLSSYSQNIKFSKTKTKTNKQTKQNKTNMERGIEEPYFKRKITPNSQGNIKGCRMGRSDKVSLWYVSLLINTRFRFFFFFFNFFYFRISNC